MQSLPTLQPLPQRAQSLKPACVTGRIIIHSGSRLLILSVSEPTLGTGAGREQDMQLRPRVSVLGSGL